MQFDELFNNLIEVLSDIDDDDIESLVSVVIEVTESVDDIQSELNVKEILDDVTEKLESVMSGDRLDLKASASEALDLIESLLDQ